jgi:hypothetical protein
MLDFSLITTEKLRLTVDNHEDGTKYNSFCRGLSCEGGICPFHDHYGFINKKCRENADEIRRLFREELERRDNMDKNKMPELKAGMIVKYVDNTPAIILPHNGELGSFTNRGRQVFNQAEIRENEIVEIYLNTTILNYYYFFSEGEIDSGYKVIWTKKNPNEDKIKELEKTIEDMTTSYNNSIEDLKRQVKDLKGDN